MAFPKIDADSFLKMFQLFHQAGMKGQEQVKKDKKEKKKLRADLAKQEAIIRSATGEEIELASGIAPKVKDDPAEEAYGLPEELRDRSEISAADQIFKNMKNKSLMDKIASLEAVTDKLPEARQDIRYEKLRAEQKEKEEQDAKDDTARFIRRELDIFNAEQKAKKEKEDAESDKILGEMTEEYSLMQRQEDLFGRAYDDIFSPSKEQMRRAESEGQDPSALKEAALYQQWQNPRARISIIGNPKAAEILSLARTYKDQIGVPPTRDQLMDPAFKAEVEGRESEKAASEKESKAAQLQRIASAVALAKAKGEDTSKFLSPLSETQRKTVASIVEARDADSKLAELRRAQDRAERKEFDIKEFREETLNNYKASFDGALTESESKSKDKDGYPKWFIGSKINPTTKSKELFYTIRPNTRLTEEEKMELKEALGGDKLPKPTGGGAGDPINIKQHFPNLPPLPR